MSTETGLVLVFAFLASSLATIEPSSHGGDMSELNRAERIIEALKQLEQFQPSRVRERGFTIHCLNGACVSSLDGDEGDVGMLTVAFPGGKAFEVEGDRFLDLQIIESVRIERDGFEAEKGPYNARVLDLAEHLRRKHSLE